MARRFAFALAVLAGLARAGRTDPWAAREVINDLNATEHWPQIILGEVDLLKSEARAREQVRDVLLLD